MVQDPGAYDRLESAEVSDTQRTMWFTNTAAYSPLPYLPAAAGIRIAEAFGLDVGGVSLAARLAGLAVYLAMVGFGLHALRAQRIQWLVFTVARAADRGVPGRHRHRRHDDERAGHHGVGIAGQGAVPGRAAEPDRDRGAAGRAIVLPLCKPTYVLVAMLVVLVHRRPFGFGGALRRWLPWAFAAVGAVLLLVWTKVRRRPPKAWA